MRLHELTENTSMASTVPGANEDLPAEPGAVAIPSGHVRLYHQTDSEETLLSIAREGINISYARGIEGPRGIYAGETPFYGSAEGRPTVEFHVPTEKWINPMVAQNVPPENIIAIHIPWHRHARYIENHQNVLNDAIAGEYDDLDGNEARAVKYIKAKHGSKSV